MHNTAHAAIIFEQQTLSPAVVGAAQAVLHLYAKRVEKLDTAK